VHGTILATPAFKVSIMKKLIGMSLMSLFLAVAGTSQAQTVKKVGNSIEKGAKKTGNKTAEVASKGKSKVFNTRVKDKTGPNNEDIYIDQRGRYYWIDKKGRNHYIPASALKNKM
jgi:hypothetical protein